MNILFLIAPSGFGKSEYTKIYCKEHPNTIVVNRDSIRASLFSTLEGYYQSADVKIREELVTQICDTIFLKALFNGYDVIVDNTNLKWEYIEKFIKIYERLYYFYTKKVYQIQFKLFDVELSEAKQRVLRRDYGYVKKDDNKVMLVWEENNQEISYDVNNLSEVKYIDKQFLDYLKIKELILNNFKDKILN